MGRRNVLSELTNVSSQNDHCQSRSSSRVGRRVDRGPGDGQRATRHTSERNEEASQVACR